MYQFGNFLTFSIALSLLLHAANLFLAVQWHLIVYQQSITWFIDLREIEVVWGESIRYRSAQRNRISWPN